jgi:hypothetical protein
MQSETVEIPTQHARAPGPCQGAGAKIAWAIVVTLVLATAIIGRVGMIAWPFLNDSGLYAYMGKTVTEGGVLYRDFYETKLPGVGLIASAFWRAFGGFWPGYVISQLMLAMLGAAMLARIARRHGNGRGSLATFLYAAVFLNFCWLVFTGFQLEPIQAFFEILAAAAAMEAIANDTLADAFTAGLAGGVAAMLKPSGIAIGAAFLLVLVWRLWKTQRPAWFARSAMQGVVFIAGALIPTGATVIYAAGAGLWPYLPNVLTQIGRYANATPMDGFIFAKLGIVGAVLAFPMLMRGFPRGKGKSEDGEWKMEDGKNASEPSSILHPPSSLLFFASAWLLIDLLGVILQRRLYLYHFMPLVCPMALLYGLMPRPARPMQILAGLLPIALFSLRWQGTAPMHMDRGFRHEAVSEYIAAHTVPGDAVYRDQIGRLLIETDRAPGSRYGTFFYFINYDQAPLDFCQGMLLDFEERRPKYIVEPIDASANRQAVREPILDVRPLRRANFLTAGRLYDQYLQQHYVVETVIDGNNIYRRREDGVVAQTPKD